MANREELVSRLKNLNTSEEDKKNYEAYAARRNEFLQKFPRETLLDVLSLDSYCLGGNEDAFCRWVINYRRWGGGAINCYRQFLAVWYDEDRELNFDSKLSKYREANPGNTEDEIVRERVFKPLSAFINSKGEDLRIKEYTSYGQHALLQILNLYFYDEFVDISTSGWIEQICKEFNLDSGKSIYAQSRAVKVFIDGLVQEIGNPNLTPSAVRGEIEVMLKLKKRKDVERGDEVSSVDEKLLEEFFADKVAPCFWNFSYKAEYGELKKEKWEECKIQCKIAMQKPAPQSHEPSTEDYQRELFLYSLRKGDFVCIWEEGKASRLVQIIDEDPPMQAPSNLKVEFVERTYEIIVSAQPNGTLEMGTPNAETMFARVALKDRERFTGQILRQCFGMDEKKQQEVLSSRIEVKYWVLVSSADREKRGNEWDGFSKMKLNARDFYYVYKKEKDGSFGRRRNQRPAYIGCREGDIMLGYDGNPDMKVCTILRCSSVPYLDAARLNLESQINFEKKVHLDTPVEQGSLKECGIKIPRSTSMFPITPEQYRDFMISARKENPDMDESVLNDAGDTLSTEEEAIKKLLEANLNVILTGAPGTGKTYAAKRIAFAMTGDTEATSEEESHIASVQFHPGYDYSDFVIGMKPVLVSKDGKEVFKGKDGKLYTTANNDPNGTQEELTEKTTSVSYDWKDGVFKKFAAKAKKAYDAVNGKKPPKFVFVIDEINRADLSRVFGELFSLLEEDYRYPRNKNGIRLPNGESFVIPENLYIIGTMNDIDRSVESMDFALRRRFAWYEVKAESSKHIIRKKVADENAAQKLESAMDDLNELIAPPLNKKDGSGTKNQGTKPSLDLRLGSEYQLGGAIFAKFEKYQNDSDDQNDSDAYTKLWDNHIENILSEYLRGRSNRKELVEALRQVFYDAIKGKPKQTETQAQGSTSSVANGDSSAPSENT